MRAIIFTFVIAVLSSTALAQYREDLPLPKGLKIVIDTYDAETKTFAVFSARFPCEGYTYVVPEALAAAVSGVNLNQIRRDPKSLLGKQLETTAKLKSISDDTVEQNHKKQTNPSALEKICSQR